MSRRPQELWLESSHRRAALMGQRAGEVLHHNRVRGRRRLLNGWLLLVGGCRRALFRLPRRSLRLSCFLLGLRQQALLFVPLLGHGLHDGLLAGAETAIHDLLLNQGLDVDGLRRCDLEIRVRGTGGVPVVRELQIGVRYQASLLAFLLARLALISMLFACDLLHLVMGTLVDEGDLGRAVSVGVGEREDHFV